jgi:DNA polymerase I-like protein with 3'-5' exonuclease and polymerase domains
MKQIKHHVAGAECIINFVEHDEDLSAFDRFLAQGDPVLGFDTESTGLDLFVADHQLRLVQLGNATEAWVLRVDRFGAAAARALHQPRQFIAHNATYDALVVDRHLGVKLEEFMPRITDTRLMGHLLDPRTPKEGGTGLTLKALSAEHVDPAAPDTQEDLTAVFNSLGLTKRSGWARVPIEHHTYILYAGLDAILAHRLHQKLAHRIRVLGLDSLLAFEHELQFLLAIMQRKGMLLDVPYVERLLVELLNEYDHYCDVADELGVENVNSPPQVAERLVAMGEKLTERTDGGALKVDKAVLSELADVDRQFVRIEAREPNPVADAVLRAKRAGKWAETYAQAFLDHRDPYNRLHPSISSLQARTGRMSVSRPPLQQLPTSEWRIRRSFIADCGHVIISSDYQAVEMRVLAALSGDHTMQQAIADGVDLHAFTAARVFGPNFTKLHRKIAKSVGFGKVYGGGAETIARQTGADIDSVRQALVAYDQTFPGIKRYSKTLVDQMQSGPREVVTPIGRRLPVDEERLYAATNYVVQSTSRDLLAKAISRLFDAGLGNYLMLPVHDELLGQAPVEDAEEIVREIGRIMECTFNDVRITSDPQVVGRSWGAAYGAPAGLSVEPLERKGRTIKPGTWIQDDLDVLSLI